MAGNEQTVRPIARTSNEVIADAIREVADPLYQQRVPSATQAGIKATLNALQKYPQHMNTFYNTLVNRIGASYVNTRSWSNPLREFKRDMMQFGDTYQEMAVGLIKAQVYDPHNEYLAQDAFGRFDVPVDSVYHTINREEWYPVTVNRAQVRQAFLNENGLGRLIAEIMNAPATSDSLDEYLQMCSLFAEYGRLGGYWRERVPDVAAAGSTQEQAKAMLRSIRKMRKEMSLMPTTQYNARHWPVAANADDLILFTTPSVSAALDVETLSSVFNISKAEVPNRIIEVPEQNVGIKGFQGVLTTREFFFVYDNLLETTQQNNAVAMSDNYYLHHWETISLSPFAPAALFWTGSQSIIASSLPDHVDAQKPKFEIHIARYAGQTSTPTDVKRGGIVQLTATNTAKKQNGTDDPNAFTPLGIEYSIGTTAKELSQWTHIDQNGMLTVGIDEQNANVPIQARATYINPNTPEVEQTISAALSVPVTGDGVIGFNPQLVVSLAIAPDTVGASKTAQLKVTGTLTDGRTADVTNMAVSASEDATVLTVDSNNLLTGVKAGSTNIDVRVLGILSKHKITVA